MSVIMYPKMKMERKGLGFYLSVTEFAPRSFIVRASNLDDTSFVNLFEGSTYEEAVDALNSIMTAFAANGVGMETM